MVDYVIDAYAWIEYLIGSKKGDKVKKIIENRENSIFTTLITLTELMSITKREGMESEKVYWNIITTSKLTGLSQEFCKEVGFLHAETKKKVKGFGLADAFVLAAARKLDAKIVTGDNHFKGFKETILLS